MILIIFSPLLFPAKLDGFLKRTDYVNRPYPLACAHIRIGKSSSGFKGDTEQRTQFTDLHILFEFLDQFVKNGSHVFIAADNMQVGIYIFFIYSA